MTRIRLVCVVLLVSASACLNGCSSGKAHTPARAAEARRAGQSSSASRPTQQPSTSADSIVYFGRVINSDLAVVAVGPGPDASDQAGTRLLAGTVSGDAFRDIGPRVPAGYLPDSVYFLDRDHGWFTTFAAGGGSELLFRSSNGGLTWQSFAAPSHSENAGSTDQLDFISPAIGWLAVPEPTGPGETLYRTADGGATWHAIAATFISLPETGLVAFDASGDKGWLGALPLWGGTPWRLYESDNGGRAWRLASLPANNNAYALPAIFGHTVVVPARGCDDNATDLQLYRSSDDGSRWTDTPTLHLGVEPYHCGELTASLPDEQTGWVAALNHNAVVVYRTIDGGTTWSMIKTPVFNVTFTPNIQATDSSHAWLFVAGIDTNNTRIYATTNGGITWTRIDQRATQ